MPKTQEQQKAPQKPAAESPKEPTSQACRAGYFYGLVGKAVIEKTTNEAGEKVERVVDHVFEARGSDKKVVFRARNVEAPYPATDDAARQMAADCRFTVHVARYDEKTGEVTGYVERELKGLPAAVAIARNGRPVETGRGRQRNANTRQTETELRAWARELYGFDSGKISRKPVEVEAASLSEAMAAGPEALMAYLRAQGVNVVPSAK